MCLQIQLVKGVAWTLGGLNELGPLHVQVVLDRVKDISSWRWVVGVDRTQPVAMRNAASCVRCITSM